MPRRAIESYRLLPSAQSDLGSIWDYTAEMWSPEQADAYLHGLADTLDALCHHPEIARERNETDPPVRLHPNRAHLITYRIEDDHPAIIRVVHNRQHWRAVLNE